MSSSSQLTELRTTLATYQAQLAQVDASLAVDGENDELNKLKSDLEEGIRVTEELINLSSKRKTRLESSDQYTIAEDAAAAASKKGTVASVPSREIEYVGATVAGLVVGMKCQAMYEDGMMYMASVNSIDVTSMTCMVTFDGYGNQSQVAIQHILIPRVTGGSKRAFVGKKTKAEYEAAREAKEAKKNQRLQMLAEKSDAKKKAAKKLEVTQKSWKAFNTGKGSVRGNSGFNKGKAKKSIFASPDTPEGKVGVSVPTQR